MSQEEVQERPQEPEYTIKYRYEQRDLPLQSDSDPCRPSEVIVEISLPHLSSAKGIDLDVLEHLLTLESQDPVAYKLVLKLPYPVLEDQGAAKFDKATSTLVVSLPVKANKDPVSSSWPFKFPMKASFLLQVSRLVFFPRFLPVKAFPQVEACLMQIILVVKSTLHFRHW